MLSIDAALVAILATPAQHISVVPVQPPCEKFRQTLWQPQAPSLCLGFHAGLP